MEKTELFTGIAGAGTAAFLGYIFGGVDGLLWALVAMSALDFFTGFIKASINKDLHSGVMWIGGLKKILIFIVVSVAVIIDRVIMPDSPLFRSLTIGYYIATEGLSVLENVSECGIPLPSGLAGALKKLKKEDE